MSLLKLSRVIRPFLAILILSSSLCLLPLWLDVFLKDPLTKSEEPVTLRRHLVLDLELELDEELELELELEVELELLLEILQDIVDVPAEPDEELPELPFEPLLLEPSFANTGFAAAKLPTSKKANSLCFNDLIYKPR
jgi:hypothetical protein